MREPPINALFKLGVASIAEPIETQSDTRVVPTSSAEHRKPTPANGRASLQQPRHQSTTNTPLINATNVYAQLTGRFIAPTRPAIILIIANIALIIGVLTQRVKYGKFIVGLSVVGTVGLVAQGLPSILS